MCGIFGVLSNESSQFQKNELKNIINDLFKSSETRGKDCAGISIYNLKNRKINVLKRNITASNFIKTLDLIILSPKKA